MTPGKCSSVGIIFGNLSHQCAQIVGGTADLLGFGSAGALTSAIMHAKSSAGSQVPDAARIVLVFDSKRGKREEKEMIDFQRQTRNPCSKYRTYVKIESQ